MKSIFILLMLALSWNGDGGQRLYAHGTHRGHYDVHTPNGIYECTEYSISRNGDVYGIDIADTYFSSKEFKIVPVSDD